MAQRIGGSFRDPSGHVYQQDGRIFRTITERAIHEYRHLQESGILRDFANSGHLIPVTEVDRAEVQLEAEDSAVVVVEHPRLPFISYPYEWSFRMLKSAALHHLDFHLALMERGITLSDSSAYNIQFIGSQPIFIDLLSLRRYREGEFWAGYRQFCDQFLNPLLLRSYTGIAHNAWYRGSPEGISAAELARILPPTRKFTPKTLIHVVLQGRLQKASSSSDRTKSAKGGKLSRAGHLGLLHQLRAWLSRLEPADDRGSFWQNYADTHSYSVEEHEKKKAFVAEFAASVRPSVLWDLGCNTGDFSETALKHGASSVVGFDFDQGALDRAFSRAQQGKLDFLPLFQDATNPTPGQGWRSVERISLADRCNADAVLGLALIHHLAVGRNVPLGEVVAWLCALAPQGVLEFVPKTDPMIEQMLASREDIFIDYSYDNFRKLVSRSANIVREQAVSASGRTLIWYGRNDS